MNKIRIVKDPKTGLWFLWVRVAGSWFLMASATTWDHIVEYADGQGCFR